MDKKTKLYIGLFVTLLLGIIITEIAKPIPIDWTPSYKSEHKKPFGCYVLKQEMAELFPVQSIETLQKSPYLSFTEGDVSDSSNYIFINDYLNFDTQELNQLIEYTEKGNNVFMAAHSFSDNLLDSFGLGLDGGRSYYEDTVLASFTNKAISPIDTFYQKGIFLVYFDSFDTLNTEVLGHITSKESKEEKINYIRIAVGNGYFYLNTLPAAFTNYHILNGQDNYVSNALSYLKETRVYWDDYLKSGRVIIKSPMRYVLNQQELKWAYYLGIVSLLLFVIFRAKRNQRIIPIIKPLENSTINFTRTIGSLYYQTNDFDEITTKKINFFLEYIRSNFYLDTQNLNEQSAKKLASKAGKNVEDCKKLLDTIIFLSSKEYKTEQDLINLNKLITAFKK